MLTRRIHPLLALPAAGMLLVGCVEQTPEGAAGGNIAVSSTADACTLSAASAESGVTTFTITNEGTQVTEFYLLADDGLRIVAERENITPGTSADLTVTLQPGDYFTACKPGMRGANVGQQSFTVTGAPVELSGDDQALFDQVVTDYTSFVKNEVAELLPKTEEFVAAYLAGDDEKARELYAPTRVHYERIEPIAEALGILDPRIDYRELDYLAEAEVLREDDPTFTEWLGFHRIEKDLWPPAPDAVQPDGSPATEGWAPSDAETRTRIGETLLADVQTLYDTVHADDFIEAQGLDIAAVSNGAMGLLEEIAVTKVTGEENWWSHRDLWDFQANLEGSRIAFDLVAPLAERSGDEGAALVEQINAEFDHLQDMLDGYGNLGDGFVLYNEVSAAEQRELTEQIDALREPLSQLTAAVLGA